MLDVAPLHFAGLPLKRGGNREREEDQQDDRADKAERSLVTRDRYMEVGRYRWDGEDSHGQDEEERHATGPFAPEALRPMFDSSDKESNAENQ